jgi:hypothetical protein
VEIQLHAFLSWALDVGEWLASRPDRLTPVETDPGTHWVGGWVGPRAVLDTVVERKIPSLRRESTPRTPIVQTVAQSPYRLSYHGSLQQRLQVLTLFSF